MNAIIIGAGPAGVSAALYILRAGFEVTLFSKGPGSLEKAHKIENYYGFPDGISGFDLYMQGVKQAEKLGAEILEEEVVGIDFAEKLCVTTTQNRFSADVIILAAGNSRLAPPIKGLKAFEGKGVSYCAVCDGFFYRGKKVAVLGNGEYALAELNELVHLAESTVLLTNGENVEESVASKIPEKTEINTRKISEFCGERNLQTIRFADGTEEHFDGVFVAWGSAGSAALARKIGVLTDNNLIVTDENMATNVPGIYAAGDCCKGMMQVAKAVYEGAAAGSSAVKYLRGNK